jgi:carbon starvation protein CstA
MRDASPLFTFFGFAGVTAAILLVVAAIVLFRNHPPYVSAALVIAVFPIFLVTRRLLALIQSRHLQGEPTGEISWRRVVLDSRQAASGFQRIGKTVEEIRTQALGYLRSTPPGTSL